MKLTRRELCRVAGASALGAMLPTVGWARNQLELGTLKIDTLSDGHLVLPGSFSLEKMPEKELLPILSKYGISTEQLEPECNVTLLRDADKTVLFDVGSGPDFMPSAGKLLAALAELDLEPSDITHVVFTHAHPDHLWGLLDDFDDPLFENASYMMGKAEWEYWLDPNTVDTISSSRTTMAVGAKRRLELIEDNIELFGDGDEILSGVSARASYGHTPGHMSFEVTSGTQSVFIVGDAIGNHHVGFERPEWISGSDQDGELAAKARVGLLEQIAHQQATLIGFHLPNGGVGRAEKMGNGYQFIAEVAQ